MTLLRITAMTLAFAMLSTGCQTTSLTSEDSVLTEPPTEFQKGLYGFFGYGEDQSRPTALRLLDQDPERVEKGQGVRVFVLGGLYLPAHLEVNEFFLTNQRIENGELVMDVKTESTYAGIPPKCQASRLRVRGTSPSDIEVTFKPIYCNWVGIGNIIYRMKIEVSQFDREQGFLAGSYKVGVNGTANGGGKGEFVMETE